MKLENKLFERFNQLKKEYMGTGLGLPIVNSIVKLLNGKIRCESSPNTGTTITITIPIGMENIESQTFKKCISHSNGMYAIGG